jgi:hypothetical protein
VNLEITDLHVPKGGTIRGLGDRCRRGRAPNEHYAERPLPGMRSLFDAFPLIERNAVERVVVLKALAAFQEAQPK